MRPEVVRRHPPVRTFIDGADYLVSLPNIAGWITSNQAGGGGLWHNKARLTDAWRKAGAWQAAQAKVPHLERVHVMAEFRFRDNRRRDPANWYPTVKAAVDGLVDAGVIDDDSPRYLLGPDMRLGPPMHGSRDYKGLLMLHLFALPLWTEGAS